MARVPSQWLRRARSVSIRATTVASTVRSGAETASCFGAPSTRLTPDMIHSPQSDASFGAGVACLGSASLVARIAVPPTPRNSMLTPGASQV